VGKMVEMHHLNLQIIDSALKHYRHLLTEFLEDDSVKKKFSDSMFGDLMKETELIALITRKLVPLIEDAAKNDAHIQIQAFKETFEGESKALEIIVFALVKYQSDLSLLKQKLIANFPRSPLRFEDIDAKIDGINEVIQLEIFGKKDFIGELELSKVYDRIFKSKRRWLF
jgi:hypothetical protein